MLSVVRVIGGLGNQMFQYAFAYSLSQKKQIIVKLDIGDFDSYGLRSYELGAFNVSYEVASQTEINSIKFQEEGLFTKIIRKVMRKNRPFADAYYEESYFQFDNSLQYKKESLYLTGYWQSEKYFQSYRSDLLKIFTLKSNLHSESMRYHQRIMNNDESISVHIRRGDYVSDEHTNSIHGVCEVEYYQRAYTQLQSKLNAAHYFIFSDDIAWTKENLSFIKQKTFIELGAEIPDHEEMHLMSLCKHNIIANSSFSWWGAWLNQDPEKVVIAPKKWFVDESRNTSDLIPEAWVRL